MIRLLVVLFIGMYATLMIMGEDRGQKRYGLMLADQRAAEAEALATAAAAEAAVATPEPAEKVVFIPAQPVMQPIEAAVQQAAAAEGPPPAPEPLAAETPAPLPAPEIPGGKLFAVTATNANVRQGPGTGFAVLDSLAAGEQVLVIDDPQAVQGWSKVRMEGDGGEGFIATRLLQPAE